MSTFDVTHHSVGLALQFIPSCVICPQKKYVFMKEENDEEKGYIFSMPLFGCSFPDVALLFKRTRGS